MYELLFLSEVAESWEECMMKKTKCFIISSIILLLLGYASFQYVYTQADFKIHTISGNPDVLNDVSMKITFNTPKVVDVLYKNQKVDYQVGNQQDPEKSLYADQELIYDDAKDNGWKEVVDDSFACSETDCKLYRRNMDEVEINYRISASGSSIDSIMIETGLKDVSKKGYQIYQEKTIINNNTTNLSIIRPNEYEHFTITLKKIKNHEYYFIPNNSGNIIGDIHLYKVIVKDNKLVTEKGAKLDDQYENLNYYVMDQQLFVLASEKKTKDMYMLSFDENGVINQKTKLPTKDIYCINNQLVNQYIVLNDDTTYYAFDCKSMKVVDECNMIDQQNLIKTAYQNGRFYTINLKSKEIDIKVYEQNKEVYHGIMQAIRDMSNGGLHDIAFLDS